MPKYRGQGGPVESRVISLFASLFFSVPTAAFLWFWTNTELAIYTNGFLHSRYLLICIVVFGALALLFPKIFPSILGGIWRGISVLWNWWI